MLLDNGNAIDSHHGQGRAEATARTHFTVMASLGYDAVNLGQEEIFFGPDKLIPLARKSGVALVSANVAIEGAADFLSPVLYLNRNGTRLAVTGVVREEPRAAPPGVAIRPWRETLEELLPEIRAKADVAILLAQFGDGDKQALQELADFQNSESLEGFDLILTRPGAVEEKGKRLFFCTPRGVDVGLIDLAVSENGATVVKSRQIPLDESVSEDPSTSDIVAKLMGPHLNTPPPPGPAPKPAAKPAPSDLEPIPSSRAKEILKNLRIP